MQFAIEYASPIGALTLASDGENITGLWFKGQKYAPPEPHTFIFEATPLLKRAAKWLDGYFKGERAAMVLPLAPSGSAFRKAVWDVLQTIPCGETTTYGAIAQRLEAFGYSSCAQAVGGAVGHNPISILIPCHRVLGSAGALTGYAGGIDKKEWLLRLEGALQGRGSPRPTRK